MQKAGGEKGLWPETEVMTTVAKLSDEVLLHAFRYLTQESLKRAMQVCR